MLLFLLPGKGPRAAKISMRPAGGTLAMSDIAYG